MKTKSTFDSIWEAAREHRPLGEPSSFGFETRLRASLAESLPSGAELIARLSWRFTFACMPVLLIAAMLLAFGQTGFLPEGLGGVVSQWSVVLPVDL